MDREVDRLAHGGDAATRGREGGTFADTFLHGIVEAMPVGVVIVGSGGTLDYANPAASRFMGASYGELEGRPIGDLSGKRLRHLVELLESHDPEFETSGDGLPILHEIVLDGEDHARRVIEAVLLRPASSRGSTFMFLSDITYRKHLETELRQRNAFLQNLIESSVDSIVAADMKGAIILFNPAAQKLLGWTEEEWRSGLHVTKLYPEGGAQEIIRKMRSQVYGGKGRLLRHETLAITKEGHQIPVSFSGGIIYDEGTEIATFGIFTDLRAIHKTEEDLEQTQEMLLQAEEMAGLGRLAAGVAHEINNPMSGIMLYANLVMEALGEKHPASADLKTIVHEAERCQAIVKDLLEFSHQSMTGRLIPVNLNDQIRRTLGILVNQPIFRNIEIQYDLESDLTPVLGNPIRLNQVFMNILVNAAQAMAGSGQIAIASRHRSRGDIVEILIADTGPGIEPKVLPRVFDPFFTTKQSGEGTGLGLSISYAIVKEHRGTIRASSVPGEGAIFTIRFPAMQKLRTGEDS